MTPTPEINWDTIRSPDECIALVPFADDDTSAERLFYLPHGTRVVDAGGHRFLLMGYGSMQGTVILRDRYRRQFHAEGDQRVKVAS